MGNFALLHLIVKVQSPASVSNEQHHEIHGGLCPTVLTIAQVDTTLHCYNAGINDGNDSHE